jgi:hypothetical membrane protein
MTHTMSYLGNFKVSSGWFIFSISIWYLSITVIPLLQYLRRMIKLINTWADEINFLLYWIGTFFFILIGVFPDTEDGSFFHRAHVFVAIVSNIFYNVGLFLLWFRSRRVFPRKNVLFVVIVYFASLFFMIFGQIYRKAIGLQYPGPGILSFTMWEWVLFYLYFVTLYSIILFLPENIEKFNLTNMELLNSSPEKN